MRAFVLAIALSAAVFFGYLGLTPHSPASAHGTASAFATSTAAVDCAASVTCNENPVDAK